MDKIFYLDSQGITEYLGNYDYYKEKLEESQTVVQEEVLTKTEQQKAKKRQQDERKRKKKEQEKISRLEEEIEKVEIGIKDLQDKTLSPGFYDNQKIVEETFKELGLLEQEKEDLYEDWFLLQDSI